MIRPIALFVVALIALAPTNAMAQGGLHPRINITVTNLSTGQAVRSHETLPDGTPFEVSVTTSGVDCAGQFVVTAVGAPDLPPSVLVQFLPFIIGPASESNTVTGFALTAGGGVPTRNAFKVSATCNGEHTAQFSFDMFEFFAQ